MAERTRRHQEWLDYFRTLVAARYQDNPLYPTAAPAAWQTMDLIDDAADIDAVKKIHLDVAAAHRERESGRPRPRDGPGRLVRGAR